MILILIFQNPSSINLLWWNTLTISEKENWIFFKPRNFVETFFFIYKNNFFKSVRSAWIWNLNFHFPSENISTRGLQESNSFLVRKSSHRILNRNVQWETIYTYDNEVPKSETILPSNSNMKMQILYTYIFEWVFERSILCCRPYFLSKTWWIHYLSRV